MPGGSAPSLTVRLTAGAAVAAVAAAAWVGAATAGTTAPVSRGLTGGSVPQAITAGPGGDLWFTEHIGNRIGRISTRGALIEYALGGGPPYVYGPPDIAAGPDGDLWFPESGSDRIARMTPRGVVTRFSAGIGAGAFPMGITAGPDGNLWFTEYGAGRVGRITPGGVVTEFATGITGGIPGPIAAGPGGDVWFAESGPDGIASRVGRITPAGRVTEYRLGGAARSGISDVAAGPDGNLWFTLRGDRVGRITPAGAVRFFSAGISPGSTPGGIAAGPDGNIWFTEGTATGRNRFAPVAGGTVARITPAGVVTEFSSGISAGAAPGGIAAGADGNLWFTEDNRIARITPAGTVSEFPPTAAILGIRLRGTRSVVVRLHCPPGAARHCRGTLTERLGPPAPRRLPALARRIDIAPGRTATVTYPLRAAGRRQLAVHDRVAVGVVLRPSPPGTAGRVQAGATLRPPDPPAVAG